MRSIVILAAGVVLAMAGTAQALTPAHGPRSAKHVHHAAHQPKAAPARPATEFAPGPEIIPDPESYEHAM